MRPVFPPCRLSRIFLAFLACASLVVSLWLASTVSAAAPDLSAHPAPLSQIYPSPPTATPGPSRTPRPIPVLPSPTATPATPLPTASAPVNDTCAAAQVLPSTGPWPLTISQDTRGATMDPAEPAVCGGDINSHSVWYRFVAPTNGWLVLDTCASDYDTVLTVWEGACSAAGQTALMCNDDDCGLQSRLWAPTTAGLTYLVRVSSYGARPGGALSLSVEFRIQPTLTPTPTFTLVPPTVTGTPYPPPWTPYPTIATPTAMPTETAFAPQPTLTTPQPVTLVPPPTVVGTATPRCAPHPYPAPDCPTATPPSSLFSSGVSIYRLPGFGGRPSQITTGPDGAVWFTDFEGGKIGRTTLAPVEITMFPLPSADRQPDGITVGPDGAIWFTERSGAIGRITPTGHITEYSLAATGIIPTFLTAGSDGALWFTGYTSSYQGRLGRLTLDGVLTEYELPAGASANLFGQIIAGPDGAIWLTAGPDGVARLTPDGHLTFFPLPTPDVRVSDLVIGPDGAIWTAGQNAIMRLGLDGVYRIVYATRGLYAGALILGPDGAIWFTTGSNKLGRLTADGSVSYYEMPDVTSYYGPYDLTAAPDRTLWFTLPWGNAIGRLDPFVPVITQTPPPTTVHTLAPPTLPPGPSFTPTPPCGPQPYPAPGCPQPTPLPVRYGDVTLYTVPADAYSELGLNQIVLGPDNALWFTETATGKIGRITTAGQITQYPLPSGGGSPTGITVGPDGALWFVEQIGNRVGRITMDGLFFTQTLPRADAYPHTIVTGPDGALWFAGYAPWLSRVTPNGPVTEYMLPLPSYGMIEDMTVGPDGALWFVQGENTIGRFVPDQGLTLFRTPSDYTFPRSLINGPDGALWYVGGHVGRLSLDGVFREFRFRTDSSFSTSASIIRGPDGALWFAHSSSYHLFQLTTDGALTEYRLSGLGGPSYYLGINDLALGPDGAIWMTLPGNQIARFDPAAPPLPRPTATPFVPPAPTIPPYPVHTPTVTLTPTLLPHPYPTNTPVPTPTGLLPTLTTPQPVTLVPPPTVVGTPTPRCAPNPYPAPDCPTPTPPAPAYSGGVSIYRLPGFDGSPRGITVGPDGALWFTEFNTGKIGRVTLAPVEITMLPLPATDRRPLDITAGPDGAVWFTEQSGSIGRITPTGDVTEYMLVDPPLMPRAITTGPDGALWFTAYEQQATNRTYIGRLTAAGLLTYYGLPADYAVSYTVQIVSGPDGVVWFNAGYRGIVRLTPDGGLTLFPHPFPTEAIEDLVVGPDGAIWTAGDSIMRLGANGAYRVVYPFPEYDAARTITVGPDGALWFTTRHGQIGRLTLDGGVTYYDLPASVSRYGASHIVTGPDGALWFTLPSNNAIGRLDPAAPLITQTPTPTVVQTLAPPTLPPGPSFTPTPPCGSQPYPGPGCTQPTALPVRYGGVNLYTVPSAGNADVDLDQMVVGPDGALWFTEFSANKIGRITTTGQVTEYALPSGGGGPSGITVGPDGALWFVEQRGNRMGRITTDGLFFTQTLPRPNSYPRRIVTGSDGALWFVGDGPWISRVAPNGPVTEYQLPLPNNRIQDLIVGPDGALWFAADYNIIGRFRPDQGVTLFRTPSNYSFPNSLTNGPDGAMWFVGGHGGRLSLDGVFREFRLRSDSLSGGGRSVIRGPDGALWFADSSGLRLFRLTTDGALTEVRLLGIPTSNYDQINDLALGPDGAIWMTLSRNRIARFDPAAPALPTPMATLTPTPLPYPAR